MMIYRDTVFALLIAILASSTATALPPPPAPSGLPLPDDEPATLVTLSADACSIAGATTLLLGADQGAPDALKPIRRRIVWERALDAGTARCDWGEFQARTFERGRYIEAFGYTDSREFAAVRGGWFFGPWAASFGECFLERDGDGWRVIGCVATGGA